jgi:hypothetical protein
MRLQGKLVITVKVLVDNPSRPCSEEKLLLQPVMFNPILPEVMKYNGAACIVSDVRNDNTCWLNSVECK